MLEPSLNMLNIVSNEKTSVDSLPISEMRIALLNSAFAIKNVCARIGGAIS